jgi:hypothetical protein
MKASDANANLSAVTSISKPEETQKTDQEMEETQQNDQQIEATQETDQQTIAEEISHPSNISENNERNPNSLPHNSTSASTKQFTTRVRTSILEHIACFLVGKSSTDLRKLAMADAPEPYEDDTETSPWLIFTTSTLFCINFCIQIFISIAIFVPSWHIPPAVPLLLPLLGFAEPLKWTTTQWYFIRTEIARRREDKAREAQGTQLTNSETDGPMSSSSETDGLLSPNNTALEDEMDTENSGQLDDVELEDVPLMRVDDEADIGLVPLRTRTWKMQLRTWIAA